jgi:hypothetical protein
VVAVLDEAANICPIRQLPQLYSHYGSRGLQVLTMLQSYQQGVTVWGADGMDTLWSASTMKLVGAGVDDHGFLQRLSGLIGDHDVEKISISHGRGTGPSRQYSSAREPILPAAALRALPKTHAILLATGRPAGLGQLLPWYRERDSEQIQTYLDTALTELRAAATDALGPDNPVLTPAPADPPPSGSAALGDAPPPGRPTEAANRVPPLAAGPRTGPDTDQDRKSVPCSPSAQPRPVSGPGWPNSAYHIAAYCAAARSRGRPGQVHTPGRDDMTRRHTSGENAGATDMSTTDTGISDTSGAAT